MTIYVDKNLFHLQTRNSSYLFQIMANGELGQLYYGHRIHHKSAYHNLSQREQHDAMASWTLDQPDFQPEMLKQEYASLGKGDFRYPAYQVQAPDGSRISELVYQDYQITQGKQRLPHLPSTFANDPQTAQTLSITLMDAVTHLQVQLNYTIFPKFDVLIRSAAFKNQGIHSLMLKQAASCQLDLPDAHYDWLQFSGAWARECQLQRHHLHCGQQATSSLRGASSHQANPAMILARPDTTENTGEAIGFNLIYSGNFANQIDVDQFQTTRIITGINPEDFTWQLKPQSSFQTPEAVISYTNQGLNNLSQQLGAFYQQHLVNQHFAQQLRPILINNWEATYFDFDETKLLKICRQAQKIGIELFVLDDGWFGQRDDDTTSLGDWFVNQRKFPHGIDHFAQKVHDLGLQFGLWFEPEMISQASRLYQQHPDWVVGAPHRHLTPSRNQFVLDMTRTDVVQYLYEQISAIIEQTHLDYIKWDMNRNLTEIYSTQLPPAQQQEFNHRYILGVYHLYELLTTKFPQVLFESCASGGGRFDLGMMYYAPQAWVSDNTDAITRLKIQYGTSYNYPLAMMGAHISAVPNDQTGRITPLATRAAVAYFGDLGYELDITKLSSPELQTLKKQIQFYKKYRQLFQFGKFYRLLSPFAGDPNLVSWQVVNSQQTVAIVGYYRILNEPNPPYRRLYLQGLDPNRIYQINDLEENFYGDELMHAGLFIPRLLHSTMHVEQTADFNAQLFLLRALS